MAEHALYDNTAEPSFPFELILNQLSWLPGYLSDHTSDPAYDLVPLLNTVLVFGRARTATLQLMPMWNLISSFAKRLNCALDSIGASHHRVELVPRGPGSFFVTCSQSPRFNWNISLTHRDVGRNLDYFAPGHVTNDPPDAKCHINFVDKDSLNIITSEVVLLKSLQDPAVRKEFHKFNDTRETLFNSTMERMGLGYRFKCIVVSPGIVDPVLLIMKELAPPLPSWWEDNCFFVNGFFLPHIIPDSRFVFCGYKAKYDVYWPLIRLAFDFTMKYKRTEYWYTSEETGFAFWEDMKDIFHRIKHTCEREYCSQEFDRSFAGFKNNLDKLAAHTDNPHKTPYITSEFRHDLPSWVKTPSSPALRFLHKYNGKFRLAKQVVYMRVFQRYKLEARLVRQGIDSPTSGDARVFL